MGMRDVKPIIGMQPVRKRQPTALYLISLPIDPWVSTGSCFDWLRDRQTVAIGPVSR